jgi:hypothetical protein
MKRFWTLLTVCVALVAPAASQAAYDAATDLEQDRAAQGNVLDRIGDWFATVGKPEAEKDRIKAERQADRLAKATGEAMEESAERAGEALERGAERTGDALKDTGDRAEDRADQISRDVQQ